MYWTYCSRFIIGMSRTGTLRTVVRVDAVRRVQATVVHPFLRRHEDDAVRSAAAVDRRRRGVLEDVDRFDHRGIEVLNAAADRNAVDDVERLVARRQRPNAADAHVHRRAGLVARRDDLDAGHAALQRLHRIGRRDVLQLVGGDGRDRAGDGAPLLFSVADDDHRAERGWAQRHRDGRRLSTDHRDAAGPQRIAETARLYEVGAGGHIGDAEVTASVGHGTARQRTDADLNSCQGSSIYSAHSADNGAAGLRDGSTGRGEENEHREENPASHQSYLRS